MQLMREMLAGENGGDAHGAESAMSGAVRMPGRRLAPGAWPPRACHAAALRASLAGLAICVPPLSRAAAGGAVQVEVYANTELRLSHAPAGSFWREQGGSTMADLSGVVRPMFSGTRGDFELKAEIDFAGQIGDTRERLQGMAVPDRQSAGAPQTLLDLESVIAVGSRHLSSARVDRLSLAWSRPWGTVTVGRQAITWGGGLVFNPFDLFNPFAPSDVVRDYKNGDDMIHLDLPLTDLGVQLLAVGRRDPLTGRISAEESSFAAQVRLRQARTDWTLMGGWHYGEPVLGLGGSGLLGEATWHVDATWLRVGTEGSGGARAFASAVANLQYSWVWGGRNVLGFVEYHFSGPGGSNYGAALLDPVLATLRSRGSLFVLGRHLGAASLQIEWHPLLNFFLGSLANLEDPSFLLQPRFVWSASDAVQVTSGVDLPVGSRGSEYGGFQVPGLVGNSAPRPSFYFLVSCWF